MILEQHYLACLSQASYLIADEASRRAVVVDPRRDVDVYVQSAEERGLTITDCILTHVHADFIAGHLELAARCGATIHLGEAARAEYPFSPLAHGQEIELGPSVRLTALATPGHTPESICLLVHDREVDDDTPLAVLTGDTLFVGDVGRPDLLASAGFSAEELAGQLHRSLHEQLLALPDSTVVYPGHGAGSACGKAIGSETQTTIGHQRALNPALQDMTEEDFVRLVTEDLPPAPAYFAHDAAHNLRQRKTLDETLETGRRPLSLVELLRAVNAGAQLVDTRPHGDYAAGHLEDAVNVGLDGRFASWAGTVLQPDRPVVLVTADGAEEESVLRLGRVGFDEVLGCLAGGMGALEARPDLVRRSETIDAAGLAVELASSDPPVILDVRGPGEWEQGRIGGSVHVPLAELRERLEEVPRGRRIVAACSSGYRSGIAVSILRRNGWSDVAGLEGGLAGWDRSQSPAAREGSS